MAPSSKNFPAAVHPRNSQRSKVIKCKPEPLAKSGCFEKNQIFKYKEVREFCEKQLKLLELEAAEEQTATLLRSTSVHVLRKRGVVLLNMSIKNVSLSVRRHTIVRLEARTSSIKALQSHSLSVGDSVGLFENSFTDPPASSGVIHAITKESVSIILSSHDHVTNLCHTTIYGIAPIDNTWTRDILTNNLRVLAQSSHPLIPYMFLKNASMSNPAKSKTHELKIPSTVNKEQTAAILSATTNPIITLVHGPAGTGKTTTLAHLVASMVHLDSRVRILACCPSNVATDNFASKVLQVGIKNIIRVGNPTKIHSSMLPYTIDGLIQKSSLNSEYRAICKTVDSLLKSLRNSQELDRKTRRLQHIETQVSSAAFANCSVVFATCNGSTDIVERLAPNFEERGYEFDYCIVDECAQGLELSAWIPILQCKRVVLGGDHKQLPPTVKSNQAREMGLGVSLFERAHKRFASHSSVCHLLKIQYRMNAVIMGWSNLHFYGNKLIAADSVKNWTIQSKSKKFADIIQAPFVFCDTKKVPGVSEIGGTHWDTSRWNPAEIVIADKYTDIIAAHSRSVISPYKKQTKEIRSEFQYKRKEIEVATVDAFQGRENDIIVLSFVRSNSTGKVGFLSDARRLNVAITRARKQVFIIGNSDTLSVKPILKSLFLYASKCGRVITPDAICKPEELLYAWKRAAVSNTKK